jgi:3-oxoacyl-[acyl-carrier protein] reductase
MNRRIIVITGGGSGIGKATAIRFAQAGDQVVIIGRTLEKLHQAIEAIGNGASCYSADISQRQQVQAAINHIVGEFGQIDVLVNNAGYVRGINTTMALEEAEAIWEDEIGANLKGSFLMALAVAPHLPRPGGRIINISSIAAYTGGSTGGVLGYGTAKAGLHGLTCALARELTPQGITVNTVVPGLVGETEFFGEWSPERMKSRIEQIPAKRAGIPEEIAESIFFLSSPEAAYISGETLNINGGWLFGK